MERRCETLPNNTKLPRESFSSLCYFLPKKQIMKLYDGMPAGVYAIYKARCNSLKGQRRRKSFITWDNLWRV